jgi:hypothetical protein
MPGEHGGESAGGMAGSFGRLAGHAGMPDAGGMGLGGAGAMERSVHTCT